MAVSDPRDETELVAEGASDEFAAAMSACDFPLVLIRDDDVIALANDAAAELLGLDVEELVGRRATELLAPGPWREQTVAVFRAGLIDNAETDRRLLRSDGSSVPVSIWSHTVTVDARTATIALVVPRAEVARLGRDPGAPWRQLAAIAMGTADPDWRIRSVSRDIETILGGDAGAFVGQSLAARLHPDDRARAEELATDPRRHHRACRVRLRDEHEQWVDTCILTAPQDGEGPSTILFAIVGPPVSSSEQNRIRELERRLRRIGAEVRAAGVLDVVDGLPAPSDYPQLSELTTRQWEILSRLLRGERVPTISSELYLSPSTVRNHLSAIFAKFGVHSQHELIELLRPRGTPERSVAHDERHAHRPDRPESRMM